MRALLALAALALLATPALALEASPLAAPGALISRGVPAGCEFGEDAHRCEWRVQASGFDSAEDWELPAFPRSLVTLTIVLTGRDNGWSYSLEELDGRQLSQSSHAANPMATSDHHAETDTHLLLRDEREPSTVRFRLDNGDARANGAVDAVRSEGEFRIVYLAERLQEGVVPERPAATRDHPQLRDDKRLDNARPWLDVEAAWFDDAALGDGLMDVHLALASLAEVDFGGKRAGDAQEPSYSWYVGFVVLDQPYLVRWFLTPPVEGSEEPVSGCELRRGSFRDAPAQDLDNSALVMTPVCVIDRERGTMEAVFPESSVGSPAAGVEFRDIFARSYEWTSTAGMQSSPPSMQDEASTVAFPFALGGPAVWSRLSSALDPPPVPPWFVAPFHEENLPDTLQVAGALTAALTFLGGLVVLGGRRRRLRRLLDQVDRAVETHEADARAALLALGELDVSFSRLFRQGRLNEAQYQVVTQRVASAATRFALRRELGLDDGTPGHGEDEGPARRVPVDVEGEGPPRVVR